MKELILASASPRRKELLGLLTEDFEIEVSQAEEEAQAPADLPIKEHPGFFAKVKAEDIARSHPDQLVIGSDTGVLVEDENGELQMLGKPVDEEDARRMLRALSGKTHQVITGVCLMTIDSQKAFATVTDVTFCHLSEEEIGYYVERYRPMDKAGSYGIQEWIGFVGVESISGSYFNVMGLPIQRLYTELKKL